MLYDDFNHGNGILSVILYELTSQHAVLMDQTVCVLPYLPVGVLPN